VRSRRVSSTHAWMGDQRFPRVRRWKIGWVLPVQGLGFGGRGFDTHGSFLFVFLAAGLVAAVDFGFGFLDPAVFLVAVTLGCSAPL
jgi:hypothetical protein